MKISWIIVTLSPKGTKRTELFKRCVYDAMDKRDYADYELLIGDNGSTDDEIFNVVEALKPTVFLRSKKNIGNPAMMNQLILRSKGFFLTTTGNDIELPNRWMRNMSMAATIIPKCGIVALPCTVPPLGTEMQVGVLRLSKEPKGAVFGPVLFSRIVLNKVGYFSEDLGLYGINDRDFSVRAGLAGFSNYYLLDFPSTHLGDDGGTHDEYRKMKWASLRKASVLYEAKCELYRAGQWYVPAPEKREFDADNC